MSLESIHKALSEMEEREKAATLGPWEVLGHDGERHGVRGPRGYAEIDGWLEPLQSSVEIHGAGDAAFLAHSRQDLPKLIKVCQEALPVLDYVSRHLQGTIAGAQAWVALEKISSILSEGSHAG
jgi:hypothetical protein